MTDNDTIVALSTGSGGAIAVIRLSGSNAHAICDSVFRAKSGHGVAQAKGYTMLYGTITDNDETVDDVVVAVFKAPHSYTGENMVEISCHASRYIVRRIIGLLIDNGARQATAGEFTMRAFLAGKMDLVQAEAVADIIASQNHASHFVSQQQMKGGYSADLAALRDKLLHIVSLIELELDFSEEDVEFADRTELNALIDAISDKIDSLIGSFSLGNAIKNGIGVAIVGSPNVGKSTLLNALLNENRAMVSEIAGTTRDVIEENMTIEGMTFRFIDTAGIRKSDDKLEQMGIERTFSAMEKANIILLLVDATKGNIEAEIDRGLSKIELNDNQQLYVVINKCDTDGDLKIDEWKGHKAVSISAKYGKNLDAVTDLLKHDMERWSLYEQTSVVTNARHYEALVRAQSSLDATKRGLKEGISTELVSQNVRETIYHLGTITGEITTNDILTEIFSKFCIGK